MYEIAQLNDAVRKTLTDSSGLQHLIEINCRYEIYVTADLKNTIKDHSCLMKKVAEFDSFDEDNDPYGEHDCFRFQFEDEWIICKFDYYAPDMEHGSEDAADLSKTIRVLTIMLASDY